MAKEHAVYRQNWGDRETQTRHLLGLCLLRICVLVWYWEISRCDWKAKSILTHLLITMESHRVVHTPVLRGAETRNRYKGTTWVLTFLWQWKVMIKDDKTPQCKELKHSSCVPRRASFYKWKKDWVEYSGQADTKSYSLPVWLPSHRSLHHSSLASEASAI